jgi:hypothetical protein
LTNRDKVRPLIPLGAAISRRRSSACYRLEAAAKAWTASYAVAGYHEGGSASSRVDRQFLFSRRDWLLNQTVRRFFELEYDRYSSSYRTDASAPIRNKVGAFLSDPMLARMLTAPKQQVRIREAMDEGKVPIANLAKGRIGEDSSSLLGDIGSRGVHARGHPT